MIIDVVFEDARWETVGLIKYADVAVSAACLELGLEGELEVCVLGCDDTRIAQLNTEFRGKPTPTNVLSWPSIDLGADAPGAIPQAATLSELGDIAISYETCEREAMDAGKTFEAHVTHLIVHATLHLLGYDHEIDADAALMEGLETKILGNLGLPDPYLQD